MTGLGGGAGSLFRHSGGGGTGDWGGLSTGDTYQNGKVYKPNATTFQIWYYPQSRKGSSVTYSMSNLTGGSFEVREQSNMKIYLIGGGGGGTGENASGGSGGGAITVNNFIPANLETFNFQVGKGGRGGWSQQASQFSGMPSGNPAIAEEGGFTNLTGTGLSLNAGGGPVDSTINATTYSSGKEATISVSNTRGLSITSGSGGKGGSRNLAGEVGANGNAGGGGSNDRGNGQSDDGGGNGSGDFGGGGGGGNGYTAAWYAGSRPGGSGGTYAFPGGYGGNTQNNDFGQDGTCPTDNTSDYPNFHAGGGRAYKQADWSGLNRGSSGGGGFPGGGGGSSYYNSNGIGSDGASGIIVFHWTL